MEPKPALLRNRDFSNAAEKRPKRSSRLARAVIVIAVLATASTPVAVLSEAHAGHAFIKCQESGWWTFSNNEQWGLFPDHWINWSLWTSHKHYIARRWNGADVSYYAYIPAEDWVQHQTNTTDGLDRYRLTTIQRAGYTEATYYQNEWSHDGCDS